jgi:hypothetical protein
MVTIQIEITNVCPLKCSNCTRFCQHHDKPFFMEEGQLRDALASLVEYAKQPHAIVGYMGGDPLTHPKFAEFCEIALEYIPREKLGLWTTFPQNKKHYREVIVKTFSNILLNDHSRDDILHAPVLMAAEDYFRKPCPRCNGNKIRDTRETKNSPIEDPCPECNGLGTVTDDLNLFAASEHCWIQESWSASINPKGAWFCEVAAALSDLFDGPQGWKVEPGWWKRVPKDFTAQMEWACRKCGAALPIERIRNSQDPRDDVSPSNLRRLEDVKSRKIKRGEIALHKEFNFDPALVGKTYPKQTYQETMYRQGIAARYDMYLVLNERGYWEPHLKEDGGYNPPKPPADQPPPLFKIFQETYGQ